MISLAVSPLVLHHVSSVHGSLQALAEKNAAIAESERCQRKLGLANRLIAALASEGDRWALTVQQLRKDYQVSEHGLKRFIHPTQVQLIFHLQ